MPHGCAMDKIYVPQKIEARWKERWPSTSSADRITDASRPPPFCLMLPPPNVTGTLHMGHSFQVSIMDCLVRYHRMLGEETLWQPGTDHAGIATQMIVERQLEANGLNRKSLGRSKFVDKIWQWKKHSGSSIQTQLKRLGTLLDWPRNCFTMDAAYAKSVQMAFLLLYRKGLIYRSKRLVNWDPFLQTAVSDLEVGMKEEEGQLWEISYPLREPSKGCGKLATSVIVATTRPETLLGDTAVAVHPDDSRYSHLIGQHAVLPLVNRLLPIIADTSIDPKFGTGCVKITPGHDFNDSEIGKKHNLPIINIFDKTACLNHQVPTRYRGLGREEARKKIIQELANGGYLVKERAYRHKVPRSDRSGVIVEPYLTEQWFVCMKRMALKGLQAVDEGRLRFIPSGWEKNYRLWLDNIQDWCISRQLWWGHRIPAWYASDGSIYVGTDEKTLRKQHALSQKLELRQDKAVLDTWFSSALWPFATLGWPQESPEMKKAYPNSTLITGFDILFFWVARMVMMGLELVGDVPFKEVYVHGLILDAKGQKMSKSKGNIIDPLDVVDGIDCGSLVRKRSANLMQSKMASRIEKETRRQFPQGIKAYGVDALRFTFLAMAITGRNLHFDFQRVEGYRNFCNKLWNASRYVLANIPQGYIQDTPPTSSLVADRWIRSRLGACITKVHDAFAEYRFDIIARTLYDFVWHDYCDWYLEWSKVIQQASHTTDPIRHANFASNIDTLASAVRLLHPSIPYITEEIWDALGENLYSGKKILLCQSSYPKDKDYPYDAKAEGEASWLQEFIISIRKLRAELNVPPKRTLCVFAIKSKEANEHVYANNEELICKLTNTQKACWIENTRKLPPSVLVLFGNIRLFLPCEGLIDVSTEIARLRGEIQKLSVISEQLKKKLAKDSFVNRAPTEVVASCRERLTHTQTVKKSRLAQLSHLTDSHAEL